MHQHGGQIRPTLQALHREYMPHLTSVYGLSNKPKILKSGASLTPGSLPEDCLWLLSQPQSHDEPYDRSENSSATSRRTSWTFAGLSLSSSSAKKATVETGIWRNGRRNTKSR
ncbi:hypothetical protein B0I37DRAFT_363907 [Chaetomium sp. MPI-CAGE-AT-0009]|nr:hypothetical protein B0I37DRAFT_363907 [Chaetomium sp. MPI-CAGE-AT-0009]